MDTKGGQLTVSKPLPEGLFARAYFPKKMLYSGRPQGGEDPPQ